MGRECSFILDFFFDGDLPVTPVGVQGGKYRGIPDGIDAQVYAGMQVSIADRHVVEITIMNTEPQRSIALRGNHNWRGPLLVVLVGLRWLFDYMLENQIYIFADELDRSGSGPERPLYVWTRAWFQFNLVFHDVDFTFTTPATTHNVVLEKHFEQRFEKRVWDMRKVEVGCRRRGGA